MKTKACLVCNNLILKPLYTSLKNWTKVKYCSLSCSAKSKENKATVLCDNCHKSYNIKPSHLARKKRHFCSSSCYSIFRSTKLPANEQNTWKGGITKETQRGRGTRKYRKWREAVLLRDGGKCLVCGTTERLEADHIKEWAKFPELRYEVSNGQTVCIKHHDRKRNRINPELLK